MLLQIEFINRKTNKIFNVEDCKKTECGISNYQNNLKIVGGSLANPNSWPASALIRICFKGSCYLCGGTLISLTSVLTASHCMLSSSTTDYIVYLGRRLGI